MRVLLDTTALLGPEPDLGEADVAISAISLAELHFGVLVAGTAEVRAERLRRLAAAVVQAGKQPRARVRDLLVAATARTHAADLWTRDGDHLI